MSITHAMWTHGHSIQIEYPHRLRQIWKAGFYVRLVGKPNTKNWFHFSIPTTVIVKDKRQMIDSVMLRFRCKSTLASVTNVHIYDGERRLATYDGLDMSPNSFGLERFDIPGKSSIWWGVGISVGVEFKGSTDDQNTMEFSSAGCDFNLFQTIRLHSKVLVEPSISVENMIAAMRQVYEPRGIRIVHASTENLNFPELETVDVGSCTRGNTTDEQDELFANRNGVDSKDIVAYFVRATNPAYNGCAAHKSGKPSCVVARFATTWTLGHEIGHILGLNHVNNNDRLMTGNGTANITNPPPDLTSTEVSTMNDSSLTINP